MGFDQSKSKSNFHYKQTSYKIDTGLVSFIHIALHSKILIRMSNTVSDHKGWQWLCTSIVLVWLCNGMDIFIPETNTSFLIILTTY